MRKFVLLCGAAVVLLAVVLVLAFTTDHGTTRPASSQVWTMTLCTPSGHCLNQSTTGANLTTNLNELTSSN